MKITTTDTSMVVTIPGRPKLTISTDLTLDELLDLGAVAADMDDMSEVEIIKAMRGALIPPSLREKIGGQPARLALPIFKAWVVEALKPLALLADDQGEAPASS